MATRILLDNDLCLIRKQKGYTLQKLEALTGIDTSTISAYEHSRFRLAIEKVQKIAEALEIPVETILPHTVEKMDTVSKPDDEKALTEPAKSQGSSALSYATDEALEAMLEHAFKAKDWRAVGDLASELSKRKNTP